jgi:hypothetical protein
MKLTHLVTALCAACTLSPRLDAAVVINPLAWGLNPGDTFRLVVITAGSTSATSTSIATYDTFVNSQGLSGITYHGAALTWQALALTPGSSPLTDSSRYSSTANSTLIYNLNGLAVSNTTNGTRFWQTSGYNQHLNPINWTINGSGNLAQVGDFNGVWTGFDWDGTPASARDYDSFGLQIGTVTAALGQSFAYNDYVYDYNTLQSQLEPKTLYPSVGRAGAVANGWAWAYDATSLTDSYQMYAMSELITVRAAATVPESGPWSISALLAGSIGFSAWRRRRPNTLAKAPAEPQAA